MQAAALISRHAPALQRPQSGASAAFRPQPVRAARRAALAVRAETASQARIVVQGRNVEATPAIKNFCEEKVGKAIKNFEGVKEVGVGMAVLRMVSRGRRRLGAGLIPIRKALSEMACCRGPGDVHGRRDRRRSPAAITLPEAVLAVQPSLPLPSRQIDVKLSVRGNPRGRGTEAHHQRDQIVEVTVYTLRWVLHACSANEGWLVGMLESGLHPVIKHSRNSHVHKMPRSTRLRCRHGMH